MGPQNVFQSVQSLLQFTAIASSQSGFLSLLVFANGAISGTPTTRWLTTIAFDLNVLDNVQYIMRLICMKEGKEGGKAW
jgi:hypothetical protein